MLLRIFPFIGWFKNYSKETFKADLIGGLTVAMVLIPQSMAYAQLAGLPAYYGLYAAFLPPFIASLFGSSNQLATGPVAVVSLMTNTALAPLATAGSEMFIMYAILLALMVGVFQFLLGVLRLGFVVNFLSHPVVNGFTNAAAFIIATSQLAKLFGVYVDTAEHHYETIFRVIVAAVEYTHLPTLGMGVLAFTIMIGLRKLNPRIPNVLIAVTVTVILSFVTGFNNDYMAQINDIRSRKARETIDTFDKSVIKEQQESQRRIELNKKLEGTRKKFGVNSVEVLHLENKIAILTIDMQHLHNHQQKLRRRLRSFRFKAVKERNQLQFYLPEDLPGGQKTIGNVWRLKVGTKQLNESQLKMMGGGAVVGDIPPELPQFKMPTLDFGIITTLLSMSVIIAILGFMEAISIAKAMAAKTGQRLDPNQELIGQGLSNIIGSCFSSYAVSGSFSRSAVNLQAGAETGLSNVISSIVVGVTLLFFTHLLYHLPQSVLAAIIMMAVVGLINVSGFIHAWRVQRYDGAISIITCVTTIFFAPHLDKGIMIGVALSIGLYLLRNTKPDIAILSKHPEGSFRHAKKHGLKECEYVVPIRFNGSLFFANVSYLELVILDEIASRPKLKHILLVCNGINELDASGEEMLSVFVSRLREGGYDISFSGFNDHVLDVLKRTHLYERIGEDHMYRYVQNAIDSIYLQTHENGDENPCPLRTAIKVGE